METCEVVISFFAHIGSLQCQRFCTSQGWSARMGPVPRQLSSSCGTAVYLQLDKGQVPRLLAYVDTAEEAEQVAQKRGPDSYQILWRQER